MTLAANLLAAIHLAYFAFVVAGIVFTAHPATRSLRLVRDPWLRIVHLLAIAIVLFEEAGAPVAHGRGWPPTAQPRRFVGSESR